MQLNGIRVWQMHNVNALHRPLHTRLQGATPSYMSHMQNLKTALTSSLGRFGGSGDWGKKHFPDRFQNLGEL